MTFFYKVTGYICITLKIASLIGSLVALGIPYWYVGDTTQSQGLEGTVKTTIREGLWKKCTDLDSSSASSSFCVDNEATTEIHIIRWLMFMVSGSIGIAVLAAGAGFAERNTTAFNVAAIFGFMSVVFNAISAGLYATIVKDDIGFELNDLYIGWGLVFISVGFMLVSSIQALILARVARNSVKESNAEGNDGK